MDDILTRFFSDLVGRLDGPMTFRLLLQPAMAMAHAFRDGRRDAREGRPPYSWAIFTEPEERRRLLREGWKATARIAALAATMDVVYQLIVMHRIRPFEVVVVVALLALLPYLLVRGLVNRMARRRIASRRLAAH